MAEQEIFPCGFIMGSCWEREKHGRRLPLDRDNLIIFMRGGRDKDWPLAKQSSPEEGLFGQNAEIYYNNIIKLFLDIHSM
jgi:hypothetical protein